MRCALRHTDLECKISNNFSTDVFSRDKFIGRGLIEISTGVFPGKMLSDRCKNHGWSAKFGVGTTANSSDVPNQFAGGDQLSVPYAVPMMSALGIDWFRFFFCYSYDSQLFGLHSTELSKMKSSKANFLRLTFRLPPKRELSILLNFFFPFIDIRHFFSSLKT